MKRFFIFPLAFITVVNGFGQIQFKHLPLKKVEKLAYAEHNMREPGCGDEDKDGKTDAIVLLEIGTIDPEASDERKLAEIAVLDKKIEALRTYANCAETHTIILKLSEGLFLKKADNFEVYSKAYYKKGYQLNAKRFKARYIEKFEIWLPGKTIILTDWNW